MPLVPPSDEVRAEEQRRCPCCVVRRITDDVVATWPRETRAFMLRVFVEQAERLARSLIDD